jgi:hypothetical protein
MEEWHESQGEEIDYGKELKMSKMGRALDLAIANYEVPVSFNPIRDYNTGLISALHADIDKAGLLLNDPNSPDFDEEKDAVMVSPENLREVASHYAISWNLETYLLQEAMTWFNGWRSEPDKYLPARLHVTLPLLLLKPNTPAQAAIERILEHSSNAAGALTIILQAPDRDLDAFDIAEVRQTLGKFEIMFGVQYAMDRMSLHNHFNYLQSQATESLLQGLKVREVRISEEWADLPPNKENIGLLELMVSDLQQNQIECIAPAGLSNTMHQCMKENGVKAYESKEREDILTPEKTEQTLKTEQEALRKTTFIGGSVFGKRA